VSLCAKRPSHCLFSQLAFATILSTLGAVGDELHFEAQRGQVISKA
jgi:hypothetical protein